MISLLAPLLQIFLNLYRPIHDCRLLKLVLRERHVQLDSIPLIPNFDEFGDQHYPQVHDGQKRLFN